MSIEREGSLTRINCDGWKCRKNYEGVDGFASAWQEAKAHGWVNAQDGHGTWKHFCKDCGRGL